MSKNILVTGGSGFIGTVICKLLVEAGYNVSNIDRKKKEIEGVTQYPFDLNNHQIKGIVLLTKPDAIIHLAADHEVGRSVLEPEVFYTNNVVNTINLLNYALEAGVKNFIFSGSSSVYGDTEIIPTPEDVPTNPVSPYAKTKAMTESILEDYSRAHEDFNYVNLRYFNAAGAMPDNSHGYTQEPASHLVPIACRKILRGEELTVNGINWMTTDGTCERDYTHVCDIASAHLSALDYLEKGVSDTFNIGLGDANSVLEVWEAVNKVAGTEFGVKAGPAREGDIAKTCADTHKAKTVLGWEPKYTLEDIVTHAYTWEAKHKRKKL